MERNIKEVKIGKQMLSAETYTTHCDLFWHHSAAYVLVSA